MSDANNIAEIVNNLYCIGLGLAPLVLGVGAVIFAYYRARTTLEQRSGANEKLVYCFDALPPEHRPAVVQLLQELQSQDPRGVVGSQIEYFFNHYKNKNLFK